MLLCGLIGTDSLNTVKKCEKAIKKMIRFCFPESCLRNLFEQEKKSGTLYEVSKTSNVISWNMYPSKQSRKSSFVRRIAVFHTIAHSEIKVRHITFFDRPDLLGLFSAFFAIGTYNDLQISSPCQHHIIARAT